MCRHRELSCTPKEYIAELLLLIVGVSVVLDLGVLLRQLDLRLQVRKTVGGTLITLRVEFRGNAVDFLLLGRVA